MFGLGSEGPRICGDAGGCWFSIECPFINFTYIRLRRVSKVAGIRERPDRVQVSCVQGSTAFGPTSFPVLPGTHRAGGTAPAGGEPAASGPSSTQECISNCKRSLAFPANVIGHAFGKVSVAEVKRRVVRWTRRGEHG